MKCRKETAKVKNVLNNLVCIYNNNNQEELFNETRTKQGAIDV